MAALLCPDVKRAPVKGDKQAPLFCGLQKPFRAPLFVEGGAGHGLPFRLPEEHTEAAENQSEQGETGAALASSGP